MSEKPLCKLVTPAGFVPIGTPELRRLCKNPNVAEFIITGISRRWLHDMLDRCTGLWGIHQHPATKGLKGQAHSASFWVVKRKAAATERGIVIEMVRDALTNLSKSLDALWLELRVEAESAQEDALGIEDFAAELAEAQARGETVPEVEAEGTTFAALLRGGPDEP